MRVVLQQQLENLRGRDADNPALLEVYEERYTELLRHLPQRPTIADAFIDFAKRHNFSFWQEDED